MRPSPLIGVFPAPALERRQRLFAALAQAFSVRFEAREQRSWHGVDGAIVFGLDESANTVPIPSLAMPELGVDGERSSTITFTSDLSLDRRFHGRSLVDEHLGARCAISVAPGDAPLALSEGRPVWVRRGAVPAGWKSASLPDEVEPGRGLRDQLRGGRFLGLLPLVAFLRHVTGEESDARPSRACFVIDDPNLHRPRYGHIDYPALLRHATQHGYHIAMATIPLDYWTTHRATADLFKAGARHLSLTVHGNNHERAELLRHASDGPALEVAAQALRRAQALERRTGVAVSRVMCAPHEECSLAMVRAMFRVGFDALALDPRRERGGPTPTGTLGGWTPAQLLDGGLPVLPRYGLPVDDDVLFRAYLGLPIILYGHHQDLAGGLDVLAEAAKHLGALGQVSWAPLAEIARTNRSLRTDGTRTTVRLYTRCTSVPLPDGTEELTAELPPSEREADAVVWCGRARANVRLSTSAATAVRFTGPFGSSAELRVEPPDGLSPIDVASPPARVRPVVRRILTEGRDRLAPIGRGS